MGLPETNGFAEGCITFKLTDNSHNLISYLFINISCFKSISIELINFIIQKYWLIEIIKLLSYKITIYFIKL